MKYLSMVPAVPYDPDFEPQLTVEEPQIYGFSNLFKSKSFGYKIFEINKRKAVAFFGNFNTRTGALGTERTLYRVEFPEEYVVLVSGGMYSDICLNGSVVTTTDKGVATIATTIINAHCSGNIERFGSSSTFSAVVVAKYIGIHASPSCSQYANWFHFNILVMPLAKAEGNWNG